MSWGNFQCNSIKEIHTSERNTYGIKQQFDMIHFHVIIFLRNHVLPGLQRQSFFKAHNFKSVLHNNFCYRLVKNINNRLLLRSKYPTNIKPNFATINSQFGLLATSKDWTTTLVKIQESSSNTTTRFMVSKGMVWSLRASTRFLKK